MKEELIGKLRALKEDLRSLRKEVAELPGERVPQKALRQAAESIATRWVEELRSPLEYKIGLSPGVIKATSEQMKRLHILSRPNNLKKSYLDTVEAVLSRFDDKFILPVQQTPLHADTVLDLRNLLPGLRNSDESDYLREAIDCASAGYARAAIVMGWCAAIDRIQKKLVALGLDKFNQASSQLKRQTSGKFKNWNKEFAVSSLSELQTVFDTDLIVVLEGMGLIDGNQADRLRVAFQYRNHSAHPGEAPVEDAHLIAFFADITGIILTNANFSL